MGVELFFGRAFGGTYDGIESCTRQNVVLHAKMKGCPFKATRRAKLGLASAALVYPPHFSSASPDSQFRHFRFDLGAHGKVLAFRSAANLIRAGKHTHADAVLSCLLFLRWCKSACWPALISAPNMVVSGKLTSRPSATLKAHPSATHSAKFPGVALRLPSKTTTEVYASGAFIMPGIVTASQLSSALADLTAAL